MSTSSVTDDIIKDTISSYIEKYMDNEGDEDKYKQFEDALSESILDLFRQVNSKHIKDITRARKIKRSPNKSKKKKSKSKSKSDGDKKPANSYAMFIKLVSFLNKTRRDDNLELSNVEVTICKDNFTNNDSKCALRYDKYQAKLMHNEAEIEGQTMTFGELYDVLVNAQEISDEFKNLMGITGIMWGLIGLDGRTNVMPFLPV